MAGYYRLLVIVLPWPNEVRITEIGSILLVFIARTRARRIVLFLTWEKVRTSHPF